MDFDEPVAIYLQIADYIVENIVKHGWPQGERIPSVRETAKELKVNVNTVVRSYGFLQEKSIISNQRGIGYFVDQDAIEKIIAWKKQEFRQNLLPRIFSQAQLLSYSPEQMLEDYKEYLQRGE